METTVAEQESSKVGFREVGGDVEEEFIGEG